MLKKVSIRFVALSLMLILLNVVYTFTLFPGDLKEISPELIRLRASSDSTDIYYFGESSNTTFAEDDSTKQSISQLCSGFFPGLHFTNINKYATHGGIYKEWLNQFDKTHAYPRAVIITLNLRSFNAAWINSDLETSLQEALVFGRSFPPLLNRFFLSLQAFDNKTKEEREQEMLKTWKEKKLKFPYAAKFNSTRAWDDAMAAGGHLKPDGSWDMEKIILACHYIKAYALNVDESNQRVRDFDLISNWCKQREVKLFLNLMAENVQYADSLVGKDLVFLMRQNRDFLVKRYSTDNCKVIDNLESVSGKEFIDQNWTTEHYRYRARMRIAANLADSIKKDFEKEYIKAY